MANHTRAYFFAPLSLVFALTACSPTPAPTSNGKLVIAVSDLPANSASQLQLDLIQLFQQQYPYQIELLPTPPELLSTRIRRHQAHIAAYGFRSREFNQNVRFTPPFQQIHEIIICSKELQTTTSDGQARRIGLSALAGSSQEQALQEQRPHYPTLGWDSRQHTTALDLLSEVAEGRQDCTAANELQLAEARNYHDNLVERQKISTPSQLAWMLPINADPKLIAQLDDFFKTIQRDGSLQHLIEQHYGSHDRLHALDAASFISRSRSVLPKYKRYFQEAAELTGEDWRLLAALAYQESHWDPLATSFSNVRGMMMLTEATADLMKVSNRLNARESIIAGAKYFVYLKNSLPPRINEPDRGWLALAAYNQGIGHLEDARILTQRKGQNPDTWNNVKKWMPLLNHPDYHPTLRYGQARGGEAVHLVENIRSFYNILKRLEPETNPYSLSLAQNHEAGVNLSKPTK